MRAARPLAIALSLVALAGCGGDEESDTAADTQPTATTETATAPEATEPATGTQTAPTEPADPDSTVSRVDAALETARQSMLAADEVPNSDLYFAGAEDVECEAPGATQPDNANERAAEWTCTIDAETNGVRCEGTATIAAKAGANPGKTSEGLEATDVEISCRPA